MSKKIREVYVVHRMTIDTYESMICTDTSSRTASSMDDAIKMINDSAEIFEESVDDIVRVCDDPTFKVIIGKDINYLDSFDIHEFRAFIEVTYI